VERDFARSPGEWTWDQYELDNNPDIRHNKRISDAAFPEFDHLIQRRFGNT
jgi:hypothetical protein